MLVQRVLLGHCGRPIEIRGGPGGRGVGELLGFARGGLGARTQPFDGGRELASGIPGARFVALQGQNHIPLPQDPATERILDEIKLFLKA